MIFVSLYTRNGAWSFWSWSFGQNRKTYSWSRHWRHCVKKHVDAIASTSRVHKRFPLGTCKSNFGLTFLTIVRSNGCAQTHWGTVPLWCALHLLQCCSSLYTKRALCVWSLRGKKYKGWNFSSRLTKMQMGIFVPLLTHLDWVPVYRQCHQGFLHRVTR